MDYSDAKKRLLAAQAILLEPTSSFEKLSSVRKLIAGVHPRIDAILAQTDKELDALQKVIGGDVIGLSANNLSERTEEEKKRKRYLLLFLKTWNSLKSEVARVQAEFDAGQNAPDAVSHASHWGRIFNFAKGPFGIITIVAAALVATSAATSVKITIYNQGCPTMVPSASMPIPIPGISFPKDPLVSGSSGEMSIPALPLTVDGTNVGRLTASSLKFNMSFELGEVDQVTFDGQELLGKVTDIKLAEKKSHDLVFICQ